MTETYNQPTSKPVRKLNGVAIGGISAAHFGAVLAWALGQKGIDMPVEIAVYIAGMAIAGIGFVSGYLTRERVK